MDYTRPDILDQANEVTKALEIFKKNLDGMVKKKVSDEQLTSLQKYFNRVEIEWKTLLMRIRR